MSKLSPFDFIKNINSNGPDLLDGCYAHEGEEAPSPDLPSKQYVPFIINRGFSQFNDTVLIANELNRYHQLPNKMQYDFYKSTVRPRKRFSKWAKKMEKSSNLSIIQETYNYSKEKAEAVLNLFSEADISVMRKRLDRGGSKNDK